MCRLAYVPHGSAVTQDDLTWLFLYLEERLGGQGAGIGLATRLEVFKGPLHDAKQAAADAWTHLLQGRSVLYHTRIATAGDIDYFNTQPFRVNTSAWRGVIAHNGHWHAGVTLGMKMRLDGGIKHELSDSAAFARLLGEYGLPKFRKSKLWPDSGVWMVCSSDIDKRRVYKMGYLGDLQFCQQTGIWASAFPTMWQGHPYEVASGVHLLHGKEPEKAKYQGYSGGASMYDSCLDQQDLERYGWGDSTHKGAPGVVRLASATDLTGKVGEDLSTRTLRALQADDLERMSIPRLEALADQLERNNHSLSTVGANYLYAMVTYHLEEAEKERQAFDVPKATLGGLRRMAATTDSGQASLPEMSVEYTRRDAKGYLVRVASKP